MELKEDIEKLQTLISKYKEIEKSNNNDHKLVLTVGYEELKAINTVLEELNNRIPRKDIEDLKEKIHWELDKNGITRGYQIIIDGYFNKLLNKE